MESLAEYCKQAMKEIDDTIADILKRQIDIEDKFLINQDKTRKICEDISEEIKIYIEDAFKNKVEDYGLRQTEMDQIFESKINVLNYQLEKHKTRFNVARDDLESLQESLELSSIYMDVKLESNREKMNLNWKILTNVIRAQETTQASLKK